MKDEAAEKEQKAVAAELGPPPAAPRSPAARPARDLGRSRSPPRGANLAAGCAAVTWAGSVGGEPSHPGKRAGLRPWERNLHSLRPAGRRLAQRAGWP